MANRQRRRGSRPQGQARRSGGPAPRELDPIAEPPGIESFREWELGPEVQDAIAAMGIERPTPIQALAIQPVLEGRDVIAKAETGTGKTLAFGAPMIAKIDPQRATVLGLILCPTRELAQQVHDVMADLGASRDVRTALVIGGDPMHPQVDAIKGGAHVVVGTPGRVMDLMRQGFLSFPWTEYAVLDEADEMLEIGFIDDIREIFKFLPAERQTLCFSATFPPELLKLAREQTREPAEIATARGVSTVDRIRQTYIDVNSEDRSLALLRMMEGSRPEDVFLVFCERRTEVDRLMRRLERTAWPIKALHGGYDQAARFRVMSAFRAGSVKMLVATDVASRGLDIRHVTVVVNFSIPKEVTAYTHRIGRTGRAGREGEAVSLVCGEDRRRWNYIVRQMNWEVEEQPFPRRPRRSLEPGAPRVPELEEAAAAEAKAEAEAKASGDGPGDGEAPVRNSGRGRNAPREQKPLPADPGAAFGAGLPSDSSEERDEPRKRRRRGPRRGGDRTRGDEENADLTPGAPEETPESGGFGAGLG